MKEKRKNDLRHRRMRWISLLLAGILCLGAGGLHVQKNVCAKSSQTSNAGSKKKNSRKVILNKSRGSGITKKQKKVLDLLMKKWTSGKYTDEYTKKRMNQLMKKWGYSSVEGGANLFSKNRFLVDPSEELPDYAQKLTDAKDVKYIYYWIYTYGKKNSMGDQYMYEWGAVYFD